MERERKGKEKKKEMGKCTQRSLLSSLLLHGVQLLLLFFLLLDPGKIILRNSEAKNENERKKNEKMKKSKGNPRGEIA